MIKMIMTNVNVYYNKQMVIAKCSIINVRDCESKVNNNSKSENCKAAVKHLAAVFFFVCSIKTNKR